MSQDNKEESKIATQARWKNYICSLIFLKSSKSCKATASPSAIKLQLSAPPPMNLSAKTLQFNMSTAAATAAIAE